MSSRRSRRPICEVGGCGSTRLHDGDDGFRYCDQGHQQSSQGTQIVEDTGELVQQGKKSRRRDESDAESTTSRGAFEGPKALEHYLLCLQLVLRKQLKWLIDVQRLPPELEMLVHDLWALRLQRLQTRVSYDSGTDTEGQSQLFSSQSEPETASGSEVSRRQRRKKKQQEELSISSGTRVGLIDTLALCYVGTLLLRIPLTVANMNTWIAQGRLPYYSAWRQVPIDMRERLPAEFQSALEPGNIMEPEKLHRKVLDTLVLFNTHYGMGVPPINHQLLLYSWMVHLALPIEAFAAAQRLAQLLDYDFAFTLNPKARSSVLLRLPEVRLLALLLVSTKLLFPFDDVERFAKSGEDLDALRLDWTSWEEACLSEHDSESSPELSFAELFRLDEEQCLDASDDRLDQYLDWYQNNIASENIRERGRAGQEADFRRSLFRLFHIAAQMDSANTSPQDDTSVSVTALDRLSQAQRFLQPNRIVRNSDANVNRVGDFYKRCRSVDSLHGPMRLLYAQGAKLAGVGLENMVEVVFRIERRLMKLEESLRREKFPIG